MPYAIVEALDGPKKGTVFPLFFESDGECDGILSETPSIKCLLYPITEETLETIYKIAGRISSKT